jgi:DNA-binding IclR family transcriptional regulator
VKDGTPIERALVVLETLAREGPMTLAQLVEAVPFPRSSIHRALQSLERQEWVSHRLWDHAYAIHSRTRHIFTGKGVPPERTEIVRAVMHRAFQAGIYCDLAILTKSGPRVIDSTDKSQIVPLKLPWTGDPLSRAVQITVPRTVLVQLLSEVQTNGSAEDRKDTTTGLHAGKLRQLREEKYHWDGHFFSAPLQWQMAIRLHSRSATKKLKDSDCIRWHEEFRQKLAQAQDRSQ